MKSILKQVLTVVLLLSVPAVFAAEQKEAVAQATVAAEKVATGFRAKAKAFGNAVSDKTSAMYNKAANSKAGKFVSAKTDAAVNYAKETRAVKALAKAKDAAKAKFFAHVWKGSNLEKGARTTALLAATGALAYGMYKLPSIYRNYVWSDLDKAKYAVEQAEKVAQKAFNAKVKAKKALVAAQNAKPNFYRSEARIKANVVKAETNFKNASEAYVKAVAAFKAAEAKLAELTKPAVKPTPAVVMPAAPVKTGPTAEQLKAVAIAQAKVAELENLQDHIKKGVAFPGMLRDAKAELETAQLAAAAA